MPDPIEMTANLVSRPTLEGKDLGCQEELLIPEYEAMGFSAVDMSAYRVTNTVLMKEFSADGPTIGFSGHTDVVTVEGQDWQTDPFALTEVDGRLYGRGVADMKGANAAFLDAVARFDSENAQGRLMVMFTSDEEGKRRHGSKRIAEQIAKRGMWVPDLVWIGEATSEAELGDAGKPGRKGSFHLDKGIITVDGGHIAYKDKRQNAIQVAAGAYLRAEAHDWDEGRATDGRSATSADSTRLVSRSKSEGTTPSVATMHMNWRYRHDLPTQQIQEGFSRMVHEAYVESGGNPDTPIEDVFEGHWRISSEPFASNIDNPHMIASVRGIERALGIRPRHSYEGGASDGTFFANTLGSDVYEFGFVGDSIHKANESVPTDDVYRLSDAYLAMLEETLGA